MVPEEAVTRIVAAAEADATGHVGRRGRAPLARAWIGSCCPAGPFLGDGVAA
jgi:hypothetical protein